MTCPSFREIIRNFAPTWFAATMGTGAISILFSAFPYGCETQPMMVLSLVFFFLNLFLFLLFTALTIARYVMFPQSWAAMLRDPSTSLYTGCFPMGLATLISVSVDLINVTYNFGGRRFLYFVWGVWWLDVAISGLCFWGMLHIISTIQRPSLDTMTATWLLPIVTLTVASSSGGVLALALQQYSAAYAITTAATAVFLVTISLLLALMIITIYILRMLVHGLPPGPKILSGFLPLGPTAQSGYSILLIGQSFKSLLPFDGSDSPFLRSQTTGDIIFVISVCSVFLLWSIACMCIIFALIGIQDVVRQTRFPVRLPFWGLVFPNGVFANLTISLSNTLDSKFLRVFGSIYAIITLLLWIWVGMRTVALVYDRTIFEDASIGNALKVAEAADYEKDAARNGSFGTSITH